MAVIVAGENLRFLLETAKIEANDFDILMDWSRGTSSRYQKNVHKAPPLDACTQIINHFKIKIDDFLYTNLKKKYDSENISIVQEEPPQYGGVGVKVDIIETERQLYERLLKSKDEIIDLLKAEIEQLKQKKVHD